MEITVKKTPVNGIQIFADGNYITSVKYSSFNESFIKHITTPNAIDSNDKYAKSMEKRLKELIVKYEIKVEEAKIKQKSGLYTKRGVSLFAEQIWNYNEIISDLKKILL